MSAPNASKIRRSFSRSVMAKLCLPVPDLGSRSKLKPKALRNSRGSRWAKSALAVMMRSSLAEKVLH